MLKFSVTKARIVIMLALFLSAFNYHLLAPVVDGFHEGEYLGSLWSIRGYLDQAAPFPVLVHGPMDFIPALAANSVGQGDALIVFTRLINTLFAATAWVLLFDLIIVCLRHTENRRIYGTLAFVLFALMIAVTPSDVVERQQAFLAIRDIFLVGMLWSFARAVTASQTILRMFLMGLAGAAGGLSLYWAYDRAIASAAFLIGAVVVLGIQKNWRDPAALLVGAVAAIGVTPQILPVGGLAENLGNLFYWIRNSGEVWHIPLTARAPALPSALAMTVLVAIFGKAALERFRAAPHDAVMPLIAGVLALQAFFLLKYINLPRQPNNYYFVWPFVLLICLAPLGLKYVRTADFAVHSFLSKLSRLEVGRREKTIFAAAVICLVVIASNNMITAAILNAKGFLSPTPDERLFPTAAQELEARLQAPEGCVLLWSNEGIFANALQRPVCTRYVYPVYASRVAESNLMAEIAETPPAIIVFDTTFWSSNIYGRSMRDRLPTVEAYLRANYEMVSYEGYIFGVRRDSVAESRSTYRP